MENIFIRKMISEFQNATVWLAKEGLFSYNIKNVPKLPITLEILSYKAFLHWTQWTIESIDNHWTIENYNNFKCHWVTDKAAVIC